MTNPVPPAIEIRDLRVDYGDYVAVNDISLQVPPGEICGLVGPNGAGKTSTFRVVATLNHPTYGTVKLCGHDVFDNTEAARRVLGYMPDLAPVPSDLKVVEYLDLYAHSYGLGSGRARRVRVEECLEAVHMADKRAAWCGKLSRGQTQRVVLARALLHRPRVLILDEPASGMDPLSRRDLRMTLRRLADEGVSIMVSSHILSELADMCTSLCVMNRGTILADGPVDEVRAKLGGDSRQLAITVLPGHAEAALELLRNTPGVDEAITQGDRISLHFRGNAEAQSALLAALVEARIALRTFEEQKSTFEEILVQVAEENRRHS